MNNIVILGDSLAYNRPDILNDNQRWPALLANILPGYKVNNLSRGLSTSERFRSFDASLLENGDVLVVQIGVVDCAPRMFTRLEHKIIYRMPSFLSKKVIAWFKKKRTQSPDRAYVLPKAFEENVFMLFEKTKHLPVVYIQILPASNKYIAANPTIAKAIDQYNSIVDICAQKYPNVHLVNLKSHNIDDCTLDDGYHLNAEGHAIVAELVASRLGKTVKAD